MRHFAFYISAKPAPDRQTLQLPNGGLCYVRIVEDVYAADDLDALDACTPRDDESVMNTHSFEQD